jgi:hypothetical protein
MREVRAMQAEGERERDKERMEEGGEKRREKCSYL